MSPPMASFRRFVRRYVALSERHPALLMLLLLALTGVSLWAMTTLRVNTNFRTLLPANTPSVLALEESEHRRGSVELYTIALQSPDPFANARFIDALAARIEAEWDEAVWVQTDEDTSFFRDNLLLYMPVERLREFRTELNASLDCQLAAANPLFVNLGRSCDAQDEVEWTFDYWIGDTLASDIGVPDDFFGDLEHHLLGNGEPEAAASTDSAPPQAAPGEDGEAGAAGAAATNGRLPPELEPYILSADGTIGVVYVQLNQPSTDVSFANRMQERGTRLIAELDPASYHPEMRAEVVGAYQSMNEAREAVGDSMTALYASGAIVLLVMLAFFRAIRGVLIVILPLCMGLAWTMGLTRVTYAELNLYTLFVGSVLLGMGIDFGIHLYGRALEGYRAGRTWNESLFEALADTGLAVLASALTTIGALLALLFSHFQGFKEFGVIASYGVALCMAAGYVALPPMVFLFEKVWPLKRTPAARKNRRLAPVGRRFWLALGVVVGVLAVGAGLSAPNAEFEYDFRNYRSKSTTSTSGIRYGQAMGKNRTSAPAIILGESVDQMREVHALLRDRLKAQDPNIKGFLTIETYVPPDQQERLAEIRRIGTMVNRRAMNRLTGETADFVAALRDLVGVQPFTLDDIPDWSLRTLQETDGAVGRLGLLFRQVEEWNILAVRDYQSRFQVLDVPSGGVMLADSTFINSDIIDTVQADGARMVLLVGIMLAVVLLLALRSVLGALVCLLTLGVAVVLTLGGMVLTGTRVGMFNMIVLPAVLGVSIDGTIHIFHRYRREGAAKLWKVLRTTGVAVAAASLTTAGGFAGLLLQSHRGIASIGQLAVIGILAALVAVFGVMPALLTLFIRDKAPATVARPASPD
jgi:uncharacterized protein